MSGASMVERRATVLPLHFDSRGGGPLKLLYHYPFRHAAGYVCAARGCFNLDNYEAETPLFPLRFRPEADPAAGRLGGIEDEPPRVDIGAFERSTGRKVDYLLVWNAAGDAPEPAQAYQQVFLSRAHHLRVLRRKD